MARSGEQVSVTRARRLNRVAASGLAVALLLSACTEPDVILPGERQGLREVLQDAEVEPETVNVSRPISLGAATTNASWAQFWGTQAYRTSHPALSATPQLVWTADIGQGNSRKQRIIADPVVGGGLIYTLDSATLVTATSTSGGTVWRSDLASPSDRSGDATGGGLAYADGRLYVTVGYGRLTTLDAATGQVIWTQDLEATGSGAPSVRGDLVYLTAGDDTGWALDKNTGRIAWQIGAASSINNILGAPPPALTDDLAIFAFGSGEVQAVFRRGGLRRWDAAVVGERRGYASSEVGDITGPPVVDGSRAYVGNQSGRIAAVALGNGDRIWTANEGAVGPIWPAGDSLFAVTDRNELVRLDQGRWQPHLGRETAEFRHGPSAPPGEDLCPFRSRRGRWPGGAGLFRRFSAEFRSHRRIARLPYGNPRRCCDLARDRRRHALCRERARAASGLPLDLPFRRAPHVPDVAPRLSHAFQIR